MIDARHLSILAVLSFAHGAAAAPSCTDAASCEQLGEIQLRAHHEDAAAVSLEQGCKLGSADACSLFAVLLVDGRGVAQDVPRALELWKDACSKGSGSACESLGLELEVGHNVKQDEPAAVASYLRGCDLGAARACRKAATMMDEDRGAKSDEAKQQVLLDKACKAHDTLGCLAAKDLADRVHPVQRVKLRTFNIGFTGAHFYKGKRSKADAQKRVDRAIKQLDGGAAFDDVVKALADVPEFGETTHEMTLVRKKHDDAQTKALFDLASKHAIATDNPSFGFVVWYRD